MKEIKTWAIYNFEKQKVKRLSADMEIFLLHNVLIAKYRERALEELIFFNAPLVHHIARKYKWSNVLYDDLIASGIEGIIAAADVFDFSKKVRFATLATHYILGRIRRIVDQENNTIRKPSHINLITIQINKLKDEEISEDDLKSLVLGRYSLNQLKLANQCRNQTTLPLEDFAELPDDKRENDEIFCLIEKYMSVLTKQEKYALSLKFGLDGNNPHTYKELDLVLKCDSELVIARCYKKIREHFENNR